MIKYLDKSNGYSDRIVWDHEKDYGNEFVNVHFRIDAEFYQPPYTNYTEDEQREFYREVRDVFGELGWTMKDDSWCCRDISNGKQSLDIHPQDFTGEILKNSVSKIAEALENNKTFKLRWVDVYQTVYDITDDEYEAYLDTKNEEIRAALFTSCQTKRTNKYYPVFHISRSLADSFRLTRIGLNDGKNYGTGQTINHIMKIIVDMTEEQYLVSALGQNDEKLVRSANKTEQKKLKLKIQYSN